MLRTVLFIAIAVFVFSVERVGAQGQRIVVTSETQLPRVAYAMSMPPSKLLTSDDATFEPFMKAVGRDIEKTLATYDIQDKGTLSTYLYGSVDYRFLNGDWSGVREEIAQLRAAQTKPDLALMIGHYREVYANAVSGSKSHSGVPSKAAFAAADSVAVNALPWDVVADTMRGLYTTSATQTREAIIARVENDLDPIAQKTGTLDGPSALNLLYYRVQLRIAPFLPQDADVLAAYITKHNKNKPDIWLARDVTLAPSDIKKPVLIGILDSGVDPSNYPGFMFGGDSAAQHGIAFADDGGPSSSDLYPLTPSVAADYPKTVPFMSGASDMQSGIISPNAIAYQHYLRSLDVDQQRTLAYEADRYDAYTHGSHVAGIAIRGNPGAKIVVARFNDQLSTLFDFPPTPDWAQRMSGDFARFSEFFRTNNVRVVNMSWSDQVSEFETWLAKTDASGDPQLRKKKAEQLYNAWRIAIEKMITGTPGTLFVAAAGNADSDASFNGAVPASLSLPNLMTVGAVNQAGDPTNFTSYGPTVVVYADGFQVLSKIPQGHEIRFSGTSMAAPNVTNLAAKLFAIDPTLTPEQVRKLIIEGATPIPNGTLKLIDPKRTVQLLQEK